MLRPLRLFLCASPLLLAGCGVFTPEMYYSSAVQETSENSSKSISSPEADFESNIISHVYCEISLGLARAATIEGADQTLAWLKNSAAITTYKLIAEDQSGFSPNTTFITPFVGSQSFAFGLGGFATANATRTETIQITYTDKELYEYNKINQSNDCRYFQRGVMIDSDLKIADFIFNKARVASRLVQQGKVAAKQPLQIFSFDINFVAAYNGNATPTWKFTRVNANSTGSFLSATRTNTNDITITIGALNNDTKALNNIQLTGNATGQSLQSQSR